jgi:hypothetical protein
MLTGAIMVVGLLLISATLGYEVLAAGDDERIVPEPVIET